MLKTLEHGERCFKNKYFHFSIENMYEKYMVYVVVFFQ